MHPNLQDPANPLPLMDVKKVVKTIGMGDQSIRSIVKHAGRLS
jgi:hypothetical protein